MYNYNPYTQPYNYNNTNYMNELQQMRDKIDKQLQQAQQPQQQVQPTIPQINQSFQLAPQTNNNNELEGRYAENVDEVKNTFVMKTAIFVTKDFSTLFVKDVSGNIKTYKTEEIIEIDEKDMQIQELQKELENMKSLMSKTISQEEIVKPKTTKKVGGTI